MRNWRHDDNRGHSKSAAGWSENRDHLSQELGTLLLIKRGVTILTAGGEDLTQTDDLMKKAMRQIAGVFAELEKHRPVAKLKGARERKKVATGKCKGCKSHTEMSPIIVTLAKRLRRKDGATGKVRSYRDISDKLAEAGHLNTNGKPYAAMSVRSMIQGRGPS